MARHYYPIYLCRCSRSHPRRQGDYYIVYRYTPCSLVTWACTKGAQNTSSSAVACSDASIDLTLQRLFLAVPMCSISPLSCRACSSYARSLIIHSACPSTKNMSNLFLFIGVPHRSKPMLFPLTSDTFSIGCPWRSTSKSTEKSTPPSRFFSSARWVRS